MKNTKQIVKLGIRFELGTAENIVSLDEEVC
jgi:hypothetical protein